MTPLRPFRLLATLLAVAGLALAACGNSGDDSSGDDTSTEGEAAIEAPPTVEEGTLSICSDSPYEPFEFEGGDNESGFTGFDIDLLDAMAGRMDLDIAVIDVDFDGILGNLAADNCDVVASAVTINDERSQEVDFTEPYFDSEQSLLVKEDSGVADLEALAGQQIGVQSDTTGQTYAEENAPEGAEVRAFDGADSLFAALESEAIDAILQDFPVNAYRATQDDSVVVVETYATDEQYGFAVKKGNSELLAALDESLAAVREDGTYDELYESYFATQPGE